MKLEQGKIIDAWSSLEITRLIYMNQKRIRYVSSSALRDAAVFFKSGALYRRRTEEGFECKKYEGNVDNLMNSVAIVESPADEPRTFYLAAIKPNVLNKNTSAEHLSLVTRLHPALKGRRPQSAAAE